MNPQRHELHFPTTLLDPDIRLHPRQRVRLSGRGGRADRSRAQTSAPHGPYGFSSPCWACAPATEEGLTHQTDTHGTLGLFPTSRRLFKPRPAKARGVNTPALLFCGQDTLRGRRTACPGGTSPEGQVWAAAPRHPYWSPARGPACNRRQDHALEPLSAGLGARPWATS